MNDFMKSIVIGAKVLLLNLISGVILFLFLNFIGLTLLEVVSALSRNVPMGSVALIIIVGLLIFNLFITGLIANKLWKWE